jgi:hypothetical protein
MTLIIDSNAVIVAHRRYCHKTLIEDNAYPAIDADNKDNKESAVFLHVDEALPQPLLYRPHLFVLLLFQLHDRSGVAHVDGPLHLLVLPLRQQPLYAFVHAFLVQTVRISCHLHFLKPFLDLVVSIRAFSYFDSLFAVRCLCAEAVLTDESLVVQKESNEGESQGHDHQPLKDESDEDLSGQLDVDESHRERHAEGH